MSTSLIANKAIRQSDYIRTQTVRVPRNSIERRDMGALFMSENKRIPFGEQLVFKNADSVCQYFGVNSEEYKIALKYFAYTEENCEKQTQISFFRWSRGTDVQTLTVVPIRLYKSTTETYDYKRDLVECLVNPMNWFNVQGYDKTPVGFATWFYDTYGKDYNGRGLVRVETRNDDVPTIYFTYSKVGNAVSTDWEQVVEPLSTDKETFVIYAEDACRVLKDSDGNYSTKLCTTRIGDKAQFRVDFDYIVYESGTQVTKRVSTFFEYRKYDNIFVKIDSPLPSREVTRKMSAEEMTAYGDGWNICFINGECYRKTADVKEGEEVIGKTYSYIVWDKKNLVWTDGGSNGNLNKVDFETYDVDSLKSLVKADYITLMKSDTILQTVDRETFKTFYNKYSKSEHDIIDACERLTEGVLNLESMILFKTAVTGKIEDVSTASYTRGDILPVASTDDFMTRFYRFNGITFDTTPISIGGKTAFDIVNNYPSYGDSAYDSPNNFSEVEGRADGTIGLVIDIANKTLASTYYKYAASTKTWSVIPNMVAKDIPTNYPSAAYEAESIVKIGEDDYEPVFESFPTSPVDGAIAKFVDYSDSTFVTYYFIYDELLAKFKYIRKSNAKELYPTVDVTCYTESALKATNMDDYADNKHVVGIVIDKSTFLTQYYSYDFEKKTWDKKGTALDIIDNYPVSGEITLFDDPYSLKDIRNLVSPNGFTVCVNPDYTTEYGELYTRYFFDRNTWTTVYENSKYEDSELYFGSYDDSIKDALEKKAETIRKYGYPNTYELVKNTTDGKIYTWVEWYFPGQSIVRDFIKLTEIEDKDGDAKYYTKETPYVSVTELADIDSKNVEWQTKYVNESNDTTCVFARDMLEYYKYYVRNVGLVFSVTAEKDYVCINRLVGADITSALESFSTDYSGIDLRFDTNRICLVPTGDKDLEGKQVYVKTNPYGEGEDKRVFYYTVHISCRDTIDSFEQLAAVIQRSVRLQRGMESVNVNAVTYRGKTHIEIEFEDSIGITAITCAESDYAERLGFKDATVETISRYPKESPLEAIMRASDTNNNFGSFSFMDKSIYDTSVSGGANVVSYEQTLSKSEINAICAWNQVGNFMFLFSQGVRQNEANSGYLDFNYLPEKSNGQGNVIVVRGGDGHDYEEIVPMSVFAATSYEEPESVKGFMFKRFNTGSFTPTIGVTETSFAEKGKAEQWAAQTAERVRMEQFDSYNLNYIVRTQEFGLQKRDYFQRGKCYDGMDISVYCAEVWLKDAFSTALLKLLMQYEKLTPTISSLNLASAVMIPVVTEAEDNGMIVVPEEALPNATRIYIDQQTGVEESYKEIEKDGYLLQFDFSTDEKNGGKAIFYRFMYCKNGDIRKIEGYQAYKS